MKSSAEYSKKLKLLYRKMKRKYAKPLKVSCEEPLEAIVYATISEKITAEQAESIMKKINEHFIDLNDLRVSRIDEISEVTGLVGPALRETAALVNNILRTVFNEYNTLTLKDLKKLGKRRARKKLEQIAGITDFAVNYCMLTSLKGHAVPLTKKMIEYLKANEVVNSASDAQQIESFLGRQILADNTYEFYALLRRASESDGIDMSETKKPGKKDVAEKDATIQKAQKRKK